MDPFEKPCLSCAGPLQWFPFHLKTQPAIFPVRPQLLAGPPACCALNQVAGQTVLKSSPPLWRALHLQASFQGGVFSKLHKRTWGQEQGCVTLLLTQPVPRAHEHTLSVSPLPGTPSFLLTISFYTLV